MPQLSYQVIKDADKTKHGHTGILTFNSEVNVSTYTVNDVIANIVKQERPNVVDMRARELYPKDHSYVLTGFRKTNNGWVCWKNHSETFKELTISLDTHAPVNNALIAMLLITNSYVKVVKNGSTNPVTIQVQTTINIC